MHVIGLLKYHRDNENLNYCMRVVDHGNLNSGQAVRCADVQ